MYYIDSHAHLFLEEFNNDRNEVIERAYNKGIHKMLLPNVDSSTLQHLLDTCQIAPDFLFPAIGLHPGSVNADYEDELFYLKKSLEKRKYVAIGEVGIDLYWDKTFYNEQILVLKEQLQWAKDFNLPVILHSRESFGQVYETVKKSEGLRGVFHAFTGTFEQAQKIIDLGFYVGIGGIVTFKNSGLDKVVAHIPLDNIILETDSPYLAPVPYRGKRNEPSYLNNIAEKLANVYGKSLEEIVKRTSINAEKLFAI